MTLLNTEMYNGGHNNSKIMYFISFTLRGKWGWIKMRQIEKSVLYFLTGSSKLLQFIFIFE